MGPGIVVAGIEAEVDKECIDYEEQNKDTNENIQEVIDFYYKMKEFLLNQTNKTQAINYGSLGYFNDETNINKNNKNNVSKTNKTHPIPIPISKSN